MDPSQLSERERFVPLVLGIVGHRDLRNCDPRKLRDSLEHIFKQFDDAYPNTPKVVLSSLAPGADQLAAEVALERGENWSVRVPLPFPVDDYQKGESFRFRHLVSPTNPQGINEDALKNFDCLRKRPRVELFVVPTPTHVDSDDVESYARICLANAGGYIVRHCHTIIALWDKKPVVEPSGTADIVRFQLSGLAPEHYPWTDLEPLGFDPDRGPVIVVYSPREGQDATDCGKITVRLPSSFEHQTYGQPEVVIEHLARKISRGERFRSRVSELWGHSKPSLHPEYDQFLAICQVLDDFNRDVSKINREAKVYGETLNERLTKAHGRQIKLFPPSEQDPTTPDLGKWYSQILTLRAVTEQLSGGFLDKIWQKGTLWLFYALFFTLAIQHVYAHPLWHIDHDHHESFGIRSILLIVILCLWPAMLTFVAVLWYYLWDNRRLDYRALSEALRVREAWAVAGLRHSVAGSYLPQLRSELAWIRRALQHVCPPPEYWESQFDQLTPQRKLERMLDINLTWIDDQIKYYSKARVREHHNGHHLKMIGIKFGLAGYVALFFIFIPLGLINEFGHVNWLPHAEEPTHPWLILAGLLFAYGAIRIAIGERRGHEQLAKQYDHMFTVFSDAKRELDVILDPALLSAFRTSDGSTPFPDQQTTVDPATVDYSRAKRVIEALGREALLEHAQWLLLHRSKPMELPLG